MDRVVPFMGKSLVLSIVFSFSDRHLLPHTKINVYSTCTSISNKGAFQCSRRLDNYAYSCQQHADTFKGHFVLCTKRLASFPFQEVDGFLVVLPWAKTKLTE